MSLLPDVLIDSVKTELRFIAYQEDSDIPVYREYRLLGRE
jgi:hypothetical protein